MTTCTVSRETRIGKEVGVYYVYISTQINQSIKGPHKATHGQGKATSQHSHRIQQTLRHEVPQAWGG